MRSANFETNNLGTDCEERTFVELQTKERERKKIVSFAPSPPPFSRLSNNTLRTRLRFPSSAYALLLIALYHILWIISGITSDAYKTRKFSSFEGPTSLNLGSIKRPTIRVLIFECRLEN